MKQISLQLHESQLHDIKDLQEKFKKEYGAHYSRSEIIRLALFEMYRNHITN